MCGDMTLRGVLVHSPHIPSGFHSEVVAKGDVGHHLRGLQHQVWASVHVVVLRLMAFCLRRAYQRLHGNLYMAQHDTYQLRRCHATMACVRWDIVMLAMHALTGCSIIATPGYSAQSPTALAQLQATTQASAISLYTVTIQAAYAVYCQAGNIARSISELTHLCARAATVVSTTVSMPRVNMMLNQHQLSSSSVANAGACSQCLCHARAGRTL